MKPLIPVGLLVVLATLTLSSASVPVRADTAGQAYRVAQAEVGYFIDRHGRKVYFDRRTNRIIAIEEPQPLRNLFERALPPLLASPPGPEADLYPPAPRDTNPPYPSTDTVPAPSRIGRAPLDPAPQGTETTAEPALPPAEAPAQTETRPAVETAAIPRPEIPEVPTRGPAIAKLQVLLDRQGYSPGVIDGVMGGNVQKAIAAARQQTGLAYDPADEVAIEAALAQTGGEAFAQYVITQEDVDGPFVETIPADYAEKAKLPAMSFTSPREMLAERFHMAESYLSALNPEVNFWVPGTVIRVVAVGQNVETPVALIQADKAAEQVRAYDGAGRLVAAYPATIGSSDTPSPSGSVQVERVAIDPNYTYNPKVNFVQGDNHSVLTIPPGPNGPVGSIWIALSKPTYGIHGTPEPDRIGKNNSHGCVRLTNWDAAELARLVAKGVAVEFIE